MFIDVNNSATMDSYYSKRMSKLYRVCREIIACSVIVPLLFFVMLFSLLFLFLFLFLLLPLLLTLFFVAKILVFADVGMMMMQTGMVKGDMNQSYVEGRKVLSNKFTLVSSIAARPPALPSPLRLRCVLL